MIENIYDYGDFDFKPEWYDWYINGHKNAAMSDVLKEECFESLEYESRPMFLRNEIGTFREEMFKAVRRIADIANSKISLCLGGMDSEALALCMFKEKIDFDIWYLKMWCAEDSEQETIHRIGKAYGARVNVMNFDWRWHKRWLVESTLETGCVATIKNCMPILINQMPAENYFLVGNENYRIKGRKLDTETLPNERFCLRPNHRCTTLKTWAQKNQRRGMSSPYDSIARLTSSILLDENLFLNPVNGTATDKYVVKKAFPELFFTAKTEPLRDVGIVKYPIDKNPRMRPSKMCRFQDKVLSMAFPTYEKEDWKRMYGFLLVDRIFKDVLERPRVQGSS